MNTIQKEDSKIILSSWKNYGILDYVSCWYKKSIDYIKNTNIQCAFVSTNSITQGEQVSIIWKELLKDGAIINFAYRTFRWDSEASLKAHVHCVIIGFSLNNNKEKVLYSDSSYKIVNNINGYLVDAPNICIENRKTPICNVGLMHNGCKFLDDGNYVFKEDEVKEFLTKDPNAKIFIKKYYGAKNFINNEKLYCIWLKNAEPINIRKSPLVMDRIEKVKKFREQCKSADTRKYANKPTLPTRLAYYSEDRNSNVLVIPIVSSEKRKYLPIGYVDKDVIISYANMIVPDTSFYTFGILESNVHMAWVKSVCGRLEMRFRYSNTIVYNNFPFPNPTDKQKEKIEKTAQGILDARALYPNSSLADLYDELTMPPELRKAHQENDKAVMEAYGFDWHNMTESDCVAQLMKMYQKLVEEKE